MLCRTQRHLNSHQRMQALDRIAPPGNWASSRPINSTASALDAPAVRSPAVRSPRNIAEPDRKLIAADRPTFSIQPASADPRQISAPRNAAPLP